MQISPPTVATASSLPNKPTDSSARGKGAPDKLTAPRPELPAPERAQSDAANKISISPQAGALETNTPSAPVYAEIWKGSVKVADIDTHGHVISHSGLLKSGGGSIGGPLLAAQRTIQVAQQVGGEIRTAGQPLDSQTLMMRARLANAYTP